MGLYEDYSTNKNEEVDGVCVDFDSCRITIARAGGANKKYEKALTRITKPFKRLLENDRLTNDKSIGILHIAYAESIIKHWDTKTGEDEEGEPIYAKDQIETPDGELIPMNAKNIIDTFQAVPDLFLDVKKEAESASLYRSQVKEAEAKN